MQPQSAPPGYSRNSEKIMDAAEPHLQARMQSSNVNLDKFFKVEAEAKA